uniref:Uncharacterized protein n=2 Tax=Avena sativa TaxID=4498 RepID=A0ACD5YLW4_AVESA
MSHSRPRRDMEEVHVGAGGDDWPGVPLAKRPRGCCSCSCCQEKKDFYESQIEILRKEMECISKGFMEERKTLQKEMQEFYQSSQLQLHELITEQGRRMQECHKNCRLIWEQFNNQLSNIEKSRDHVQQYSNPRTYCDEGERRKYRMKFENKCCDTEYSNQDIMADNGHPLKVAIYDWDNRIITEGPLSSIKVKVVVLHGIFNNDHKEHWKREYFREKMISSRPGKPPLLSEDLYPRLEDGVANIYGVKFQDNSSFVPSKRFRLGVMAVDDSMSEKIQEGISQSFAVRDRRGLSTKKNPYPSSCDPVYKLSGIAMKGDRHRLLERHGIKKVEDLLHSYSKNPEGLREIFGKISDHDWDKIINHAHKCNQVAQICSSSIQEKNMPHEHEPFSKTNDSGYLKLKGPCSIQASPTQQKQNDSQAHHQKISSSYNGLSSSTSPGNALQASCSMLAAPGLEFRTDQNVVPYGELGGIQVTGQQVTCIGSEIVSASSMDNNIFDGSNSQRVESLGSDIIPDGNGPPPGIDLSQWLDILQNQTFDDSLVTDTLHWGVPDSTLDSTACEAGNMLDSPFSEASISYVGHSPVSETGRGRSSLPFRGASSRSYRGHSASPLRGAGTRSYRRHSASPLRVEGPRSRSYEGHNPPPVYGAGSTSYASADFTVQDILS